MRGHKLGRGQAHVVVLLQPGDAAYLVFHFRLVAGAVDEFAGLEGRSRHGEHQAVGHRIELCRSYVAAAGHLASHHAPHVAQKQRLLLAVGRTDAVEHEGLYGTLVGAHTQYLHLHSHLVEQRLEVGRHRSQTVHVDSPHRVEQHAVGNSGHIVVALAVALVAIGYHRLVAAGLEVEQGIAQAAHRGCRGLRALAVKIDALYLLFGLGNFYRLHHVAQARRAFLALYHGHHAGGPRDIGTALGYGTRELDIEHRVVLYRLHLALGKSCHDRKAHSHCTQAKHHERQKGSHQGTAHGEYEFLHHSFVV